MTTFTKSLQYPDMYTDEETGMVYITAPGQSIEAFIEVIEDERINPPVPAPIIPDRLSRRQFRLALIDAGLLEQVEAWIATQDIRTQAAYADSSTFLRSDDMLQQNFAGLGFTEQQVNEFFTAAAQL